MFAAANQAHSRSLSPHQPRLQGSVLRGVEAYQSAVPFPVELVTERPRPDIDSLLPQPGLVSAFEARARVSRPDPPRRPRAMRQAPDALTISTWSRATCSYLGTAPTRRIFQHLTVPQIIARVLRGPWHQADAYRFQ